MPPPGSAERPRTTTRPFRRSRSRSARAPATTGTARRSPAALRSGTWRPGRPPGATASARSRLTAATRCGSRRPTLLRTRSSRASRSRTTRPLLPSRPRLLRIRSAPANDNAPEITGTAEAGSTVKRLHDRELHRRPAGDRHRGGLRLARDHGGRLRRHLDDLQGDGDGRGRQRLAAARRLGRRTSRTRRRRRFRRSLASSPARPCQQQLARRSRVRPRPARRSSSTRPAAAPALRATGTAAGFASPGITVSVADDTTTTFKATATDAAGNVSGCSTRRSPTSRTRPRPALRPALASSPRRPANDNTPEITGSRRGRLDGQALHERGLHGRRRGDRHRRRFASPGITVSVADDTIDDLQRDGDGRGRQRLRLLDLLGHLRRGLDAARRCPASLDLDPASPANDNNSPTITGSGRGRLDGQGLLRRGACTGAPTATGTAAALRLAGDHGSRSPTTRPRPSTRRRPTPPATSPAARPRRHLRRGLDGARASDLARVSPVGPANNNSPEITGTAEAGSTVKIYTTRRCTGAPAATGHRGGVLVAGITVTVADDIDHDLLGDGHRRRRQHLRLLDRPRSPTSRTRPRPRARRRSPRTPAVAGATTTRRAITGTRRGRLDGQALHERRLHGRARGHRHRCRLRLAGITVARRRRHDHDLQGDGDGRGGQRLRPARAARSPTSRTRPRRRSEPRSRRRPASPANDNRPEITGSAEAGSTVKLYTTAPAPARPSRPAPRPTFASPGITARVADDTHHDLQGDGDRCGGQHLRLLDALGHLRRGLDRAGAPGPRSQSPGLAGERQLAGDHAAPPRRARRSRSTPPATAPARPRRPAPRPPSLARDHVAVADDTTTTFNATATDAAGNASGCSSSSVTYVEDSTAPARPTSSPPAQPRRRTTTRLQIRAPPRPARRSSSTPRGAAPVARTATGSAASVLVARDHRRGHRRHRPRPSTRRRPTPPATSPAARTLASPTSRTRRRPRFPPRSRAPARLGPANDNRPAINGTAEAGSTVKLYTTSDCSRLARGQWHGGSVRLAGDHGRRLRRQHDDVQGNGDRRRRERLRLLELLGDVRRGLDGLPRARPRSTSTPGFARQRQLAQGLAARPRPARQ